MWTQLFTAQWHTPHTVNVILVVLHDVFSRHVLSNQFPGHFGCGWSWPSYSLDMNPCEGGYLKGCMYCTNILCRNCKTLLLKRSQVTCCVTKLINLWFVYIESMRLKDLTLNMCSHEDHMHTHSP